MVQTRRKTNSAAAFASRASRRVKYEIDPDHTRLGFAAQYKLVSTVRGDLRSFAGYVEVDPQLPSGVECRIEIGTISLDTGVGWLSLHGNRRRLDLLAHFQGA